MDRRCPACGAQVQASDQFCENCGATLTPASVMPMQDRPPSVHTSPAYTPANAAPPFQQQPVARQSWSGVVTVSPSPPPSPTVVFSPQTRQHSFVVRALWYIFVGWWLSGIVMILGYLFTVTIVGMPLGFYFLNRIPQALTLRARTTAFRTEFRDGVTYVVETELPQYPWYIRALWFAFVGWWLGALWLTAAWLLSIPIITLPISIWMYNRTSGVITLQRH
ncbi:MAG: hypothetical protein KatS3mg059_1616 [Thermomicrobiales bacterium]|nr:MAG: hypothetical protein KatS3mg059_1616 [Thermomicrobiales bacterium]